MKNVTPINESKLKKQDIERQATEWLLSFDKSKPTKMEFINFMKWYKADPAHQSCFDELSETMDVGFTLPAHNSSLSASQSTSQTAAPQKRNKTLDVFKPVAAAAMLLLAVFVTLQNTQLSNLEQHQHFATEQYQRLEKTLFDGSVVTLDSNTALSVDLIPQKRNLTLSQGQAFFDVSHDSSRPFVVSTPYGSVTAVGTAFSVDVYNGQLHVVVTEGRVAIAETDQPLAMVDAGHKAVLQNNAVNVEAASDSEQALNWRSGKLSFQGETLAEVIHTVERYHNISINIEDQRLAQLKFGGNFDADNIQGLLESLETGFNISYRADDSGNLSLFQQ